MPVNLDAKRTADEDEKLEKEASVFNQALNVLNSYWHGKLYDGFLVSSTGLGCLELPHLYNDHGNASAFLAAGITRIRQEPNLQRYRAELQMLVKHAVRTSYTQLFIKCAIPSCTHCSRHPVHAVKSVQFLRDHQGRMLTPRPSLTHPGHFSTFLECAHFCTPRQRLLA